MAYQPPLDDIAFALKHHAQLDELATWYPTPGVDLATTVELLGEAGRLIADEIATIALVGDTVGCVRNADGSVTTPPGTIEAYRSFTEAGWAGISLPEKWGGGGFPWVVTIAVQEMLAAANMGFSLCPLLTQGAIEALEHHASLEQQQTYLPNLVSGRWSATMNLTEPDAGSDVGALRSKAVPTDDGSYRISGTKIFITYGEHDLTENIIHLVLARTPNASPGTKGISIFIVPKYLLNADGSIAKRNTVTCTKVEHKIGIHASPTCVLEFDDAIGYLIGDEGSGMRTMFTMMNNARLSVGLQGLAVSEAAFQMASEYATNRQQGRASDKHGPGSSPIIDHPDVQSMLAVMRANIDAMRALIYLDAANVDRASSHPEAAERKHAANLVALLTPLCKSWSTDLGVEMASLGIQVHGGMGYIEETEAARPWRDSRIAPIYEGTNGIQAIDLITRKISLDGGRTLDDLLAKIADEAGDTAQLAAVKTATAWIRSALTEGRIDDALAGATPYQRMLATVVGDWLLQRVAPLGERQRAIAEVFRTRVMPSVDGLAPSVSAGAAVLRAALGLIHRKTGNYGRPAFRLIVGHTSDDLWHLPCHSIREGIEQ